MTATSQSTDTASKASRPQCLPRRGGLPLAAAMSLISVIGCMDTSGSVAEDTSNTNTDQVASDDPVRTALRDGAIATPQAIGGFCTQGVGVYLSAVNNTAEMTLYVVAPATSATFARPALYLTTQEGDHSKTDAAEFEDVTLEAGESRVFSKEADGTLMEVVADFAGEEG